MEQGSPLPRHFAAYYTRMAEKTGHYKAVQKFYRLIMAPGMTQCGAGADRNLFGNLLNFAPAHDADYNISTARSVEDGVAPGYIIAAKECDDLTYGIELTRPFVPPSATGAVGREGQYGRCSELEIPGLKIGASNPRA